MYSIHTLKRKNSKKYSFSHFIGNTENEVIDYLKKNNIEVKEYPYFFSHIKLNNNTIIVQENVIAGMSITCSPVKLRDRLEKNTV